MRSNLYRFLIGFIILFSVTEYSWAADATPKTADAKHMKTCELNTKDPSQASQQAKKRIAERKNAIETGQIDKSEGPKCSCFHDLNGKLYDSEGNLVAYCVELQETLFYKESISGKNGIDLVSNYIYLVYKYGASIIGIICVLIVIVSGIQISMAGAIGNADSAKERIWAAALSLLLLFASGLILKTVNPGFFL